MSQDEARPYLPVEVGEFKVKEATGEAAKAQVWAEACRAGEQRVGVHSGTLKVGHPCLFTSHMRLVLMANIQKGAKPRLE